ncbi:hypothetical protein Cni_G19574 [Canna indica]|uniref:Uncharacterized protein n=1 Tax=Canna indica TaxID=4628 RepID=A0AAQ3QJV9_9LILI|nr:hypothetical protein Cni_G19572 [Canna indica]WOL10815.1 hypothetical protein Cni_G19574 [Canna indica]
MKLVWCSKIASKSYIAAVNALADRNLKETNVAEMVSALAGGWKAQLVVEACASGAGAATSIALQAAIQHAQGRHVCVVPDE